MDAVAVRALQFIALRGAEALRIGEVRTPYAGADGRNTTTGCAVPAPRGNQCWLVTRRLQPSRRSGFAASHFAALPRATAPVTR
ncbi:hypothetical protein BC826DRAFT_1014875, partial [Russula brevipes]